MKQNIIYRLQHLLILTHHYQHSLRGVKISTSGLLTQFQYILHHQLDRRQHDLQQPRGSR